MKSSRLSVLHRRARALVLAVLLFWIAPSGLSAQDGFPAFVAVYRFEQLHWLENENRVDDLCRDASDRSECYARTLAPLLHPIPLFQSPDRSSESPGTLFTIATPGRGFSTTYFSADGAEAGVDFVPDLVDRDWGYGGFFHHSFTEWKGSWFRLGPGPWGDSAWFESSASDPRTDVTWIYPDMVVVVRQPDGSEWSGFVLEASRESVLLRPEFDADMWCQAGNPPPIPDFESRSYTRAELLDDDGRMRIRLKYLRGC